MSFMGNNNRVILNIWRCDISICSSSIAIVSSGVMCGISSRLNSLDN